MALDLQHFEFDFSSSVLTKAWRTYLQLRWTRLPLEGKQSQFLVNGERVSFLREKKKIRELHCSCKRGPLCVHTAVALFAAENLQIEPVPAAEKNLRRPVSRLHAAIQRQLKGAKRPAQLPAFKTLDFTGILAYYLHLPTFVQDEAEFMEWDAKFQKEIRTYIREGLDSMSIKDLFVACLLALRPTKNHSGRSWSFLIALLVHYPVAPDDIKTLQRSLGRPSPVDFHSEGPDYRLISALQLQLAGDLRANRRATSAMEALAHAHAWICRGFFKKGMRLLKNYVSDENAARRMPEPALLAFGLEQSVQAQDTGYEVFFIAMQLRYALQVNPSALHRLRELLGASAFRELVLTLAQETPADWLEKKKDLLLAAGDRKALQLFLKQPLRFNSILQVLTAILPLVPDRCSDLLVKAIPEALQESARREWQEHILSQCQPYLSRLPSAQRAEIVKRVIAAMGERSHVSDWFKEMI